MSDDTEKCPNDPKREGPCPVCTGPCERKYIPNESAWIQELEGSVVKYRSLHDEKMAAAKLEWRQHYDKLETDYEQRIADLEQENERLRLQRDKSSQYAQRMVKAFEQRENVVEAAREVNGTAFWPNNPDEVVAAANAIERLAAALDVLDKKDSE